MPSAVVPPSINQQGNPQPSRVDSVRSLRMNTNATPLADNRFMQMQQQQAQNQNQNQLPINSDNEHTQEVVEATQPLSPQLALLAKQRRALQREREAFEQEKAQPRSTGTDMVDLARLKSEPLSVLLENGVTYDQLTEAIMNNQSNSEINELKAKLEAIEKGVDEKFNQKSQDERKQVISEMTREAQQLVNLSDDFELVREMKSIPQVITLIERTYDDTGEILDVSEALRLVEEELFKDVQRMTGFKKIQQQMNPITQQQVQNQAQQRQQGTMRTLTNRDTASIPVSKKQRALAAFYGQPFQK